MPCEWLRVVMVVVVVVVVAAAEQDTNDNNIRTHLEYLSSLTNTRKGR